MLKTNRKENVTLCSGKQTNNKKRMLKWNVKENVILAQSAFIC